MKGIHGNYKPQANIDHTTELVINKVEKKEWISPDTSFPAAPATW
jgi:hypothetical protein